MIELFLWALPEALISAFQNKTLGAGSVNGERILLQAPGGLKEKRKSSRGALVLTKSYLYFFKGNNLIETHKLLLSDLSKVKLGLLAGFTFRHETKNSEFTCYVENPRKWARSIKNLK